MLSSSFTVLQQLLLQNHNMNYISDVKSGKYNCGKVGSKWTFHFCIQFNFAIRHYIYIHCLLYESRHDDSVTYFL